MDRFCKNGERLKALDSKSSEVRTCQSTFARPCETFCECIARNKRSTRCTASVRRTPSRYNGVTRGCVVQQLNMEGWLRGRKRSTRNRVRVTPSRVRIPPPPQIERSESYGGGARCLRTVRRDEKGGGMSGAKRTTAEPGS